MIIKRYLTAILLICLANLTFAGRNENKQNKKTEDAVIDMTHEMFIQNIFDYPNSHTWSYKGNKPALIDFYATWCGPCKRIAPIVAEMAETYKGQIVVYKVDTDQEQKLATAMGIRSLPTLLLIPTDGQPQIIVGATDKATLKKAIEEVLLPNTTKQKDTQQ